METIYFTGFFASGKTMIGKLVATRKNLGFIDAKNEDDLFKKVNQGNIVALSNNLIVDEKYIERIKKTGKVIYLRGKAKALYKNLNEDTVERKEFSDNFSVFSVERELEKRKLYYEELANYIIDIDDRTINSIFKEALAIYNYINKVKCHIYIK